MSPRALPAIYLGIDTERNGHLVEVPGLENRVTTGYHVVFNEDIYFDELESSILFFRSFETLNFVMFFKIRR